MRYEDVIYAFKRLAIAEVIVTVPVLIFCFINLNIHTASVILGLCFVYFITFALFLVYSVLSDLED